MMHGWQSESTHGPKGGWSCAFWSGCSGHLTTTAECSVVWCGVVWSCSCSCSCSCSVVVAVAVAVVVVLFSVSVGVVAVTVAVVVVV